MEYTKQPKYRGVTLDRTLTYKFNCEKTKQKISARNNMLKKLCANANGKQTPEFRTVAQPLSLPSAEYANSVVQI